MANILIVDDEPAIVTLMSFILEKVGHKVTHAGNGMEALGALGVEPLDVEKPLPDLVVLDVMMPIMDGLTAARRLQGDARAQRVPLIIVTAKHDLRSAFQDLPNVAGFFSKPFDPQTLRAAVEKALIK